MQSERNVTSFFYSPTVVGFNNNFWRSTSGNPTVTGNKIRLNADAAYSYPQFRFGIFEFGVTVPTAPASGDDRKWGLRIPELGDNGAIYFKISGSTLSAISYNNDGSVSDTQDIPWDSDWTNTETRFQIIWNEQGVRILINDTDPIVLKTSKQVGDVPLSLYLDNQSSDNLDFSYVLVKECKSVVDPRTIGEGLSGEFQHDADSWSQATATDADVDAVRSKMFSNVAVARHLQMTVSDVVTVKFNDISSPGIVIRPNTRARWNNVYVTNIYITTTATTTIDIYLQANKE